MASEALGKLLEGLSEIGALQRANPTPEEGGGLTRPQVTRAIGRAAVVLLCSHFERYLRDINEEAVEKIRAAAPPAKRLPEPLRLLHAKDPIDQLAQTSWERRSGALGKFTRVEAPLWVDSGRVEYLDADRLVSWMRSPKCDVIVRLFRMWGITDIFSEITRKPTTRGRLWLRISDLVDKRNNIAHGDFTAEATYLDIVQYREAVRTFCARSDGRMAQQIAMILECGRPW